MEKLVNGDEENVKEEDKMTVAKAKQVANIGNVMIKSAQVEVQYAKVIGKVDTPTGFLNKEEENNNLKKLGS